MRAKTFRGLFWKCVIIWIAVFAVFQLAGTAFQVSVYDPVTWLAFKLLQLVLCFIAGFFLRKKTDYALFGADGSEKKYTKIAFACIALSVFFLIFPDLLAMPYVLATDKVYAITGLDFSYFDLWCLSACLGCAFFKIKGKKKA